MIRASIPSAPGDDNDARLHIVVDRFPAVSETFILNELRALEARGYRLVVLSCSPRDGCDGWIDPDLQAPILYARRTGAARTVGALLRLILRRPVTGARLLADAWRCVPRSPKRLWRAASAVAVADELARQTEATGCCHIHAHFLHRPALVGRLLGAMRGVTYSISAHARDVFVPDYRADALCRDAAFIAVCSDEAHLALIRRVAHDDACKVVRCYHGIDLGRYRFLVDRSRESDGILRCVSVCRLVAKKGVDTVLSAMASLKGRGIGVHCRIAGTGPEDGRLREHSARLGLEEVEFLGDASPDEVRALYEWADALILGSRTASDGDRDGIPNVILEAMATGVPVVAASAGGVPEVIRDGETGFLVRPDDPEAMADALQRIWHDPSLTQAVTQRARKEIEARFDLQRNIDALIALLDGALNPAAQERSGRRPRRPFLTI